MKTPTTIAILFVLVLVAAGIELVINNTKEPTLDDYVACTADAKICPDGSAVGRTGPNCEFAACPVVEEPKSDSITITEPVVGAMVSSPLILTGEAVGPWFFEASAPVEVQDAIGNVLGQSFITAQGEWMTTDFVPFVGEISFTVPAGVGEGVVVFKKDNPSGLPEHNDELVVPVNFAQ